LHRSFLPSFGSFGQTVSEEKFFLEINHSESDNGISFFEISGKPSFVEAVL
jgi:hypothetical protein